MTMPETRCACEVPEVESQLIRAGIDRCANCRREFRPAPTPYAGTADPFFNRKPGETYDDARARLARTEMDKSN